VSNVLLPVRSPGHRNLPLIAGNTVEELAGVVVFGEIRDSGCSVEGLEVGSVEGAGEVLGNAAAQRSAGVDRDGEQPDGIIGPLQRHLDQIRTLVLQTQQADVRQIRPVRPVLQVLGSQEFDGEVDRVGDRHDPVLAGRVPDHFGVSELDRGGRDHWVIGVGFEGVPAIPAVSYILVFDAHHAARVLGEGVDCHDAVVLIGKEAASVIGVDYAGAGEDKGKVVWRPEGDLLVFPVVEVGGGLDAGQHRSHIRN
jgi:hypothetical protein